MILPRCLLLLLTAAVLGAAGCRCPAPPCLPATGAAPCACELAPPPDGPPDLAAVTPCCLEEDTGPPFRLPLPQGDYLALDEASCKCGAARNATLAHLVQLERHWANTLACCEEGLAEKPLCLTRDLLTLHGCELRNESAGSALSAFYLLAGVEAQIHYADRGIAELRTALARIDALEEDGLPLPDEIDRASLAVRLRLLRDKRLQLDFTRIELNGQLQRLLGCPLNADQGFSPVFDWAPDLEPIDIDLLVAEGLANRVDLKSLQLVRCRLERATLPVARAVLSVADSTLGAVVPVEGVLHHLRCGGCKEHEVPVRCRQLTLLLADTRRTAEVAIKSAAYKITVQQDRVRLARQAVEKRRSEFAELEKLRDAEDISIFEISAARGLVLEAEAELVQQVVELKIARAGLKQVQGMLAVECGCDPAVCLSCCTGECCGCESCSRVSCRPLPDTGCCDLVNPACCD